MAENLDKKQVRIFEKDENTIIHGECQVSLLENVKPGSVDLIFADPPYNIGKQFGNSTDRWSSMSEYVEWCKVWLQLCIDALSPSGSMYIMTGTQSMPFLDIFLQDRISVISRIVWTYDSSGVQAKKYYGSMYEPILFCVKDRKQYTFNAEAIEVEAKTGAKRKLIDYRRKEPRVYNSKKVPGNTWYFPRVRYRMEEYEEHPTQKPEKLLERVIAASSNPGDLVLDPFAGTFTTCSVAKKMARRFVGIEKELDYVKIGLRRCEILNELDGKKLTGVIKTFNHKNSKKSISAQENNLFDTNKKDK